MPRWRSTSARRCWRSHSRSLSPPPFRATRQSPRSDPLPSEPVPVGPLVTRRHTLPHAYYTHARARAHARTPLLLNPPSPHSWGAVLRIGPQLRASRSRQAACNIHHATCSVRRQRATERDGLQLRHRLLARTLARVGSGEGGARASTLRPLPPARAVSSRCSRAQRASVRLPRAMDALAYASQSMTSLRVA